MQDSKIGWTHHTFNPWRGCVKVAPECEHCYALDQTNRWNGAHGTWGTEASGGKRIMAAPGSWNQVRKWDRESARELETGAAHRRRVFVASLADVFEEWDGPILDINGRQYGIDSLNDPDLSEITVGPEGWGDEWIGNNGWTPLTMSHVRKRLFNLIEECPDLDFLLLTKRPENIRKFWEPTMVLDGLDVYPKLHRSNVWLGTSAGTQATANKAIPELLKCRDLAPVLFVSAEPLLEPVDFSRVGGADNTSGWFVDSLAGWWTSEWQTSADSFEQSQCEQGPALDWVIAGGESGRQARDCDVQWLESIRDQCAAASVPFFMKQLGTQAVEKFRGVPSPVSPEAWLGRVKHPKGGDPAEWPEALRVQQFPGVSR